MPPFKKSILLRIMDTTLIVDLNISLDGHKIGFMQEIFEYLKKHNKTNRYCFLSNIPIDKSKNDLVWNYVVKSRTTKSIVAKYQDQLNVIFKKAAEINALEIILMELDVYQLALGKQMILPFKISGIWFRPFFRQEFTGTAFKDKFLYLLNKTKKKWLLKTVLKNPNIDRIFILNDQKSVDYYNKNFLNVFHYLPDPIFNTSQPEVINIKEFYGIPFSNKVFLIFGILDERKNIVNIIDAFDRLPHKERNNSTLLMVGKVSDANKEILNEAITEKKNNFQVIIRDEFVQDSHMEALFDQSDLILRMNVNYFASSGVIGMAAKYNKPSLVSNYGLVEELTLAHKLGFSANPSNISEIRDKLIDFTHNPEKWQIDGTRYTAEHSTKAFVETLLNL